jgi:hypothetical protein
MASTLSRGAALKDLESAVSISRNARQNLANKIVAAAEAGLGITLIANTVSLSRSTVYGIIAAAPEQEDIQK